MRICPDCAASHVDDDRFCHNDGAATISMDGDPLLGMTLGSYRIVRMIGEGGMGQVYLGVHPGIGSRVAIKVLDAKAASRQDLVDRFFAEATAVNRIRHENIVNVLDLDSLELPDGARPYIIMEHLEGQPLSSVLAHFRTLPQGTLTQLALEILRALEAAHKTGIIHRDLKPDNVFVSPQGRAKVLDFGIAKLLPNPALGDPGGQFTQTGMLLGTPSYMSPEQARGASITHAADIYAVGVMLYEASTGQVPFVGETLYQLLHQHVEVPPVPPRKLNPQIHPALESVILRALAKQPEDRFRSAREMADALTHAAAMFPVGAWASISLGGGEPVLVADPTPRPTPSGNAIYAPEPAAHTPRPLHGRPASKTGWWIGGAIAVVAAGVTAALLIPRERGESLAASEAETDAAVAIAIEQAQTPDGGPADPPTNPIAAAGTPAPEAPDSTPPTTTKTNKDATATKPSAGTPTSKTPNTTVSQDAKKPAAKPSPTMANSTDAGTGSVTIPSSSITMINTADLAEKAGFKPFSVPASTSKFNAVTYVGTARKLARRLMSDAKLTEIDINHVAPNGFANLNRKGADATYRFRSPSRSKRPADVPRGVEVDIACMIYVEVHHNKAAVYAVTSEDCKDTFRRAPRCGLALLWQRAYALGAPKGNWVAKFSYDKGWFINISNGEGDSDFVESLADDC